MLALYRRKCYSLNDDDMLLEYEWADAHSYFCEKWHSDGNLCKHDSPIISDMAELLQKNQRRVVGMSKKETYEQKTEALISPLVEEKGFELVDVEYVKEGGNWYLRAYIDKPGGITVDDCEVISRALSDKLDEDDFIDEAYILEVSSPGLGRPLKKEKDFARSIGQEVELRTYRAIDRQKEFTGILNAYDKSSITLEMENEEKLVFDRANVALVRLAFDF